MNNYSEQLESSLNAGHSLEEALAKLQTCGASPVEVIIAIRQVNKVSLREAKEVFAQSPSWALEVSQGDKLHEELIAILSPKNSLK